jgi:hypothetical protein
LAGGIYNHEGTVTFVRSIVAHGTTGENYAGVGVFISQGDNLSSDATCVATDPALNGVRYNACPPPDIDQRGVSRSAGERCDISAVEMSADSSPLPVAIDIKPGTRRERGTNRRSPQEFPFTAQHPGQQPGKIQQLAHGNTGSHHMIAKSVGVMTVLAEGVQIIEQQIGIITFRTAPAKPASSRLSSRNDERM